MGVSTAFFCLSSIVNPTLTMWRVPEFNCRGKNRGDQPYAQEKYKVRDGSSSHTSLENGHLNSHLNAQMYGQLNSQLELEIIANEHQIE